MKTGSNDKPLVTRNRLVNDLRSLGVGSGQVVMLHASVKAVGWVVGGPDMIIQALLDVLTPQGTLMMLVSWEDGTYEMAEWPEDKRRAYLDECPAFDPGRSRAYRKWGILTEYLRTWPGAGRSAHPDCSFTAVGRLARWITADHPLQFGHGPGSPLAKLCEKQGKVLLLGTPFTTLTLLHYSEHMADVPGKSVVHYQAPVLKDGQRQWIDIEEFDTCKLIGQWEGDGYFEIIPQEALRLGIGRFGNVGNARAYLFDADRLNAFAVEWLEHHLSNNGNTTRR